MADNRFSSLFRGTPLHGVATFVEIGTPTNLWGDLLAVRAKGGVQRFGSENEWGSGINWVTRNAGKALGSRALTALRIGDVASYSLSLVGAFSLGYNYSIEAQCVTGLL
jgi:hypothetical protein